MGAGDAGREDRLRRGDVSSQAARSSGRLGRRGLPRVSPGALTPLRSFSWGLVVKAVCSSERRSLVVRALQNHLSIAYLFIAEI